MSFSLSPIMTSPAEVVKSYAFETRQWLSRNISSNVCSALKSVATGTKKCFARMKAVDNTRYISIPNDSPNCLNQFQYRELLAKTGLKASDYQPIKEYVDRNIEGWRKQLSEVPKDESFTIRVLNKESGLPCIIHVVMEKGTLYVMVVTEKGLGNGNQRRVSHAFDMLSGTRWAYSATNDNSILEEQDVIKHLAKPVDHLQHIQKKVLYSPVGLVRYGALTGHFTPLMDGTLEDIIKRKHQLTEKQRIEILGDLIDGLYLLAEKGVEHNDIKPRNILYKIEGNRIRAYIADFGMCSYHDPVKLQEKSIQPNFLAGNRYFDSPEKRRYIEASDQGRNNEKDEILKKMSDETWLKHDVWSLGESLNQYLFDKTQGPEKSQVTIYQRGYAYNLVCDNRQFHRTLDDDFYDVNFKTKAPTSEPPTNSLYHFVWRMKHYRPWERPSAQELYRDFQQFLVLRSIHQATQQKSILSRLIS